MEVIDISKFYRFDSIPNPLIIASDIIQFDQNNRDVNQYIEIDHCKQWFNELSTKKHFRKFDEIITSYFGTNKNLDPTLVKNSYIKKILNNSNIYLVIKITKIDHNNSSFTVLPINNLEGLANTAVNRLYLHRDGLFEIDPNSSHDLSFQRKSATNRRFYCLDDLLTTQGVFDSELDTKTKDLTIETEDDLRKRKGLADKILGDDPKFYSIVDYENLDYLPEIDPEPEYTGIDSKDSIWLHKYGIPRQDYEYNESEMDNTLFNNPIKYSTGAYKEIFPLFESLNDAENFLLTILEDLLEPLKKKEISMTKRNFFELTRKEQYTLLLPTSYILNIENSEVLDPSNFNNIERSKTLIKNGDFLRKKSNVQQIEKKDFDDSYKINNFDQNAFIPISNSFLLDQAINIGVIKVGLGDFLNLWFSLDFCQEEITSKFQERFLKYIKISKSNKFKGNLLFIPELVNKTQDTLENNYLNKLKPIKDFNKVFKKSKIKSRKVKFVYKLGKIMDLYDVNSLVMSDLKL